MPSLKERLQQSGKQVREIIGRGAITVAQTLRMTGFSLAADTTTPDYQWWDNFRRGKQKGFELASLLARPIVETIASWVLGSEIKVQLAEAGTLENENDPRFYTNRMLAKLTKRTHSMLLNMAMDLYGLGDQYVIVNPDGSFSIPSPETVEIIRDELDYRRVLAYKIVTRLKSAIVTDTYTVEGRTLSIKWGDSRPGETFAFQNLIGVIPVVHFANERSGNETHGRPVYEPMYRWYSRYDDLLEKALDGAEFLSDPIPTWEGMEDVDETIEANTFSTGNQIADDNGDLIPERQVDWQRQRAVFVGKGGSFKFTSPGTGFTSDIREMLKVLFLLMMEFTRIPEAMWGNELSSARATAEEQMKTFFMYIESRRVALEGTSRDAELGVEAENGLQQLFDIWLRMRALVDKRIVVDTLNISWSKLGTMDKKLQLEWTQWAYSAGLMTDASALGQSELVEDAAQEVEKAQAETESRQQAEDPFGFDAEQNAQGDETESDSLLEDAA